PKPGGASAAGFGRLVTRDGAVFDRPLASGEALINAWTAEELGVGPGDAIDVDYFTVGAAENLTPARGRFTVVDVVAMTDLGADGDLVQPYPGIADVDNMADWDPPFPVDLGTIRNADEVYWDDYGAAPKLIVGLEDGRARWTSRWGDTTTLRFAPADPAIAPSASGPDTFDAALGVLRESLRQRAPLDAEALVFEPVRATGLDAAQGPTDFASLFLGMSQFLIAAAALLAALLFRLAVEQRASEIGLRLAVGHPRRRVAGRLLAEGGLLAALGGLVGLAGAIGYASLLMTGLRTRWVDAVGTTDLTLQLVPATLVAGYVASVLVILATVAWTARRAARQPAVGLLRGRLDADDARGGRPGRMARICALVGLVGAPLLAIALIAGGRGHDAGAFFPVGLLLMIGLLGLVALQLGRGSGGLPRGAGGGAIVRLALSNGGRHRGRSLVSVILIAAACFSIVTVAAFRHDFRGDALGRDSGAGGFQLVADAEIPLHENINDPDGRFELGLDDDPFAGGTAMALRVRPGDDASCLNLYQPREPRLLGVPDDLIARGGFGFQAIDEASAGGDAPEAIADNPWRLLERDLGVDPATGAPIVPVIGDANSTQWILRLPLGDDLTLRNARGETVQLRLVATLATSVFQRELLLAEDQLLRHFPATEGFGAFLFDVPADAAGDVGAALERDLAPYGFDVVETRARLAAFHAVQNTYLATFRTLGGLGLLLGTLGLGIVLLRNVLERRGELAAMRAFGFRRPSLVALVTWENLVLLALGIGIGAMSALAAVAGHVARAVDQVPWTAIASTLAIVFAVGAAISFACAYGALRTPLLPALKAER
ncbi:MAG: ABC transporter permease, partial [Acidobacteriota bacterium]